MFITKDRFWTGFNAQQDWVFVQSPVKYTHLRCRYGEIYIRKICTAWAICHDLHKKKVDCEKWEAGGTEVKQTRKDISTKYAMQLFCV
jgi:hypothetical protein